MGLPLLEARLGQRGMLALQQILKVSRYYLYRAPGPYLTQPLCIALGESFGRGAMTNHYIDFRNADVILNMEACS